MKVLGIETSCDETAAAVVEASAGDFVVRELSNVVHSQIDLHKEFGGVVPNLAKREHEKLLSGIVLKALGDAGMSVEVGSGAVDVSSVEGLFERNQTLFEHACDGLFYIEKPDIDLIAVTNGPGLEPALWTGVTLARALALLWGVPIIGVDHMQGHLCANFIRVDGFSPPSFPAVGLTVSGGHTQLVYMKQPLQYELLGETLDDAAGEAFDKVARMLGMPYPGGPCIAESALKGDPEAFSLPRPMLRSRTFEFSFSGLKTAVRYLIEDLGEEETKRRTSDIAASFQQAVVDVVVHKTVEAVQQCDVRSVILGGGVIANKELRTQLQNAISSHTQATYHAPPPLLATDNAAMIATSGALEHIHNNIVDDPQTLSVNANKQIDE